MLNSRMLHRGDQDAEPDASPPRRQRAVLTEGKTLSWADREALERQTPKTCPKKEELPYPEREEKMDTLMSFFQHRMCKRSRN
jgi:hypothetical protein